MTAQGSQADDPPGDTIDVGTDRRTVDGTDVAHVGIVIVTYNSAASIGALLDSIPASLDGLRASVVVVDNGSQDATADLVDRHGGATVVRATNRGYAAGINLGIARLGPCDAYLILNPDLTLAPGAARLLFDAVAPDRRGIAVPQVRDCDGRLQRSLRREPTFWRAAGFGRAGWASLCEHVRAPSDYVHSRQVDWALGAALLVHAGTVAAVGPWDESYFLHSEETDFMLRARDAGHATRYVPGALVVHRGQGSGHDGRVHAMQVVNRVRLYRRRHRAGAAWCYLLVTALQEASWCVRGAAQSRAALRALAVPSSRPPELCCSDRLMPR